MKKYQAIIKDISKQTKLTQVQLGQLVWPDDKSSLTQARIAKYETGRATPPGDVLLRIINIGEQFK